MVTMITRMITPILVWQWGHIPDGVGCSPWGCFNVQKWQFGAGVGLGCLELIGLFMNIQ
jgi:hypothetical protein